GDERSGRAEIAGALPEGERPQRYQQQERRPQAVLQEEESQQGEDGLAGNFSGREFDPVGTAQGMRKQEWPKAGYCPKQKEPHSTSRREDRQRRLGAYVAHPQHESQGWKQYHPQGPLRADTERDGDAHEQNALPVPQNDVARSVQRVSGGDAGKDQAEGSPRAQDVGLDLAAAGDRHGRETIEAESDGSAEVAVEPPRHIPERRSQQQAGHQERQAHQETKVAKS